MSHHPPPGASFDVVRGHVGNSQTCGAAWFPAQSDAKSTLMRARTRSWLHPPTVTTTHPSFGEGKVTWLSGHWSLTHPAPPAKPSRTAREGRSPGRRPTLLHAHSTSTLTHSAARPRHVHAEPCRGQSRASRHCWELHVHSEGV